MTDSNALLPNGMIDTLPDDAEREARAEENLKSIFGKFGYRLVRPPLLEFEDTLLAEGAGRALSTNTFRLMDPVSQRMMALRSDTTAQIARISASRMKPAQRPLRLAYIADVLRIQSTQLRPERQFCQAGCELIGATGKTAPTEVALLALSALHENGVRNISIDFAIPEIIKLVSKGAKQKDKIFKACQRRDHGAFKELGATGKILAALDDMAGPADEFMAKRKKFKASAAISKILSQMEEVIKDLQKALKVYGIEKNIAITVDPLETNGFEYQSFPCFTLFSKGIRGELGRGGVYTSQFGDHAEKACGFTLYMDSVLRALPQGVPAKSILVADSADWKDVKNLQSKGWNVVRAPGGVDEKHGKNSGASHIFKNGKVKEL